MELIEVSNFKNGRYLLNNMKSDKHAMLTGSLLASFSVDSLGSNYSEKIYYDTQDYFFADSGINIYTVNINGKNKELVIRYDSDQVKRIEFLKHIPSFFKVKINKDDNIYKYIDLISEAIYKIFPAGLNVNLEEYLRSSVPMIKIFKKRESYRVVNNSGLKMVMSFDNTEYSAVRGKGKLLQPNLDIVCESYRNPDDFGIFLKSVIRDYPQLIKIENNELTAARNNI